MKVLSFFLILWLPVVIITGQVSVKDKITGEIRRNLSDDGYIPIIVVLKDQVNLAILNRQFEDMNADLQYRAATLIHELQANAEYSQKDLLNFLTEKPAGQIRNIQPFWIANVIACEVKSELIIDMCNNSDIHSVYPDNEMRISEPVTHFPAERNLNNAEPGLKEINAQLMWKLGYTGNGRLVMNINTGVDGNHPAPAGRYQFAWDATDFAEGVYFYQLTAGDFRQTRKLIVINSDKQ